MSKAGLQAGLPSGCPAFRPDYNRAFRSVKPLGLTVIGPSGPIARLHKRAGPPDVADVAATPSSLTPCPCPPGVLSRPVGRVDPRRCYAAAGHLSELGWRLICVSRTLVSSEACPDVDVAVRMPVNV